jgi:hypothetical protein
VTNLSQPALHDLIEAVYALFSPYTLGPSLCVCKSCCVNDTQEQALLRTPLWEVSWEVLNDGFFVSARDYSGRESWEMSHFLLRVLEQATQFAFSVHSFARLDGNASFWVGVTIAGFIAQYLSFGVAGAEPA